MLRLRVITALVLLTILLPILLQPNPDPFIFFALLFLSAGMWEWGRLNFLSQKDAILLGLIFGCVLLYIWTRTVIFMSAELWLVSAIFWFLGVPLLLIGGVGSWMKLPQILRIIFGIIALGFAWFAIIKARAIGINYLLSIFVLVWVADVFAYMGGKAFGKRKLAPTISPGKSWEGALTGMLGVLVVAAIWIYVDTLYLTDSLSFFSSAFFSHPVLCWLLFSLLAGLSVLGDLVESLVKRSAGVKDSSNLLPGHGGVLDRIDAMLPVLPLAALFSGV